MTIGHRTLCFDPHVQKMVLRALGKKSNLTRLMLNVGRPRETKRRVLKIIMDSEMFYESLVWMVVLIVVIEKGSIDY